MRQIKIGKQYRHFKGMVVEVLLIARDSEDLNDMVIYKHVEEQEYWVRPLKMFLSEEDISNREDNVTGQKYRFEEI